MLFISQFQTKDKKSIPKDVQERYLSVIKYFVDFGEYNWDHHKALLFKYFSSGLESIINICFMNTLL